MVLSNIFVATLDEVVMCRRCMEASPWYSVQVKFGFSEFVRVPGNACPDAIVVFPFPA